MKQGTRTLIGIGMLLASLAVGACASGGGQPPIEQPPPPPLQSLEIIVHEEHAVGLLGALVTLDDGQTRTTSGEGHVHFDVSRSHDVRIQATGYLPYETNLAPWDQPHMVYLTPDPEQRPKSLNIVIHGDRGRPIGGALVTLDNGLQATSNGDGFVSLGAWRDHNLTIRLEGYLEYATNLAPWVDVNGIPQSHQVYLTREKPTEPPPGQHPDPVHGRIRTNGNQCFMDDSGCRGFAVVHMGDLVARWMYGCREACLRDLDDAAAAGYHIVRAWWHLGVNHWPWDGGGDPHYPGVDVFETPNYVAQGIELANAVASRGMRIAIGSGGLARMNSQQERDMARIFRQVIDGAGADKFAWAEGVNEPSSTHATSDNDGDNQPANLSALTRIMTEGTGIPFHGGYWNNNDYRDDAGHQLPGQTYNYVHGWRGGNVFNKIDRRFTWCRIYQHESGRSELRLTIDGESVGWPVSGPPLRYVSATANAHEMDSSEALGLIAAATAVRGIPSHMSGTGVQRFESFTQTVGWTQIPWVIRQMPRDVHTFNLLHGGQTGDSRLIFQATRNSAGVLMRVDQAIADDGRFVAIAYNQNANQHQSVPLQRTATFRVCDVEAKQCGDEITVQRGQSVPVDAFWGRVLVGQAQ